MKTLYININGENIQSTNDIIVVGRPEDAIVNKFFFELGKEILKGVVAPGVTSIKKKDVVTDFKAHDEKSYNLIMEQWEILKQELLGENPSGIRTVKLPDEYISWLQNSSQPAYAEIAKALYKRGGCVEVSLDKIYKNAIGIILNNIESFDYKRFVVNDNSVTDDSMIVMSVTEIIPQILFIPNEDWNNAKYDSCQQENNAEIPSPLAAGANIIEFPIDCGFKIDKYLDEHDAKRAGLPLFNDGLLLVENLSSHKLGYMDEQGVIVIPCTYRDAMPFSGGYAWVQQDNEYGKWFIIDHKGNVKNIISKGVDIKYCNGSQLELGDNSFYTQKGDVIGVNYSGRSYEYHSLSEKGIVYSRNGHDRFIENEFAIVQTEDIIISQSNGLYGVINQISGRVYLPTEYTKILYLGQYLFYLEKDSRHKFLAMINI